MNKLLFARAHVIFLVLLTVAAVPAFSQSRVFKWETEMCIHEAAYDTKKHTEEELRNTVRLFFPGEFTFIPNSTVWNYDEIAELDLDVVTAEYEQKFAELKALKIVKVPYWEDVRQRKLKEMAENYELARVTMLAYTDPAVLRSYDGADECRTKYAEPIIAGGRRLIDIWREVNMDSRSRNADPERLRREFEAENASPARMKFALVETMAFGWFNCANAAFDRDERDHHTAFEKLFRKVKSECDEP